MVAMIGSKRICCFPVYHVGSLFPLLAYWFSLTFTWVRRNTAELKKKMMTKLYTEKKLSHNFEFSCTSFSYFKKNDARKTKESGYFAGFTTSVSAFFTEVNSPFVSQLVETFGHIVV